MLCRFSVISRGAVIAGLAGVLALALCLPACSKSEEQTAASAGSAPAPATGSQAGAATPAGGDITAALRAVMTHYDAMRALLVEDEGAGMAERARAMQEAAARAAGSAPAEARARLEDLARHAEAMAALPADAVDRMRAGFGEISRPLVELLEQHPALAREYHLFRCPMAEGYQQWVQVDSSISNPYMGTSMPDCGSEVEWKTP